MEENSSVSEHILKMSRYHNHLTQLGVNLPDDSVIDRVLQSLLKGHAVPPCVVLVIDDHLYGLFFTLSYILRICP